jgi:hypothetical protein
MKQSLPVYFSNRAGEGTLLVQLQVAIGTHHQETLGGDSPRHVVQKPHRGIIEPLQVIEEQHQWNLLGDVDKELSNRLKKADVLL